MKLTYRLSTALLVVAVLVLTLQAWWRLTRDLSAFELDMFQDHRAMGRALGNAITEIWLADGRDEALALLAAANEREDEINIEWVWADEIETDPVRFPGGTRPTDVGPVDAWFFADRDLAPRLHTYVPVDVPSRRYGLIHLSEGLDQERAFLQASVTNAVTGTTILALVFGATASLLGIWFVGRPVRALVEKARRVGEGNLEVPVRLDTRDEFGELASELNAMSARLAETRRHLETETRSRLEAVEQLRNADRLTTVGRLSAAIAHELGTPLNVVTLRAQMLEDGEVAPADVPAQARSIGEHAEQMARIIQQLLNFARPQAAERSVADVGGLLAQAAALLGPVAAKQGATLALTLPQPPILASVDPSQIQQVLTNLIVNALQAMDAPGSVRLSARTTPEGGAIIEVADDGAGIPPDELPRIFEPFFSTKSAGAGLGLSVILGIVRDHGGDIEVASTPGQGSTFSVRLPVAHVAEAGTEGDHAG